MLPPLTAGFALGLSLIVAIGAQNLFVLRQGIRREHVLAVALVCAVSDAALIALGVSGVGLVLAAAPWAIDLARWAGAGFLLVYAFLAARRAWRPSATTDAATAAATSARPVGPESPDVTDAATPGTTTVRTRLAPVLLTCLALTWLNPHVYLDTVFLLGSVAQTHGDARWWFAAGAMTGSLTWFVALAYGARFLGRLFASARAWRILDAVIAVVMAAIAVSLVLGA